MLKKALTLAFVVLTLCFSAVRIVDARNEQLTFYSDGLSMIFENGESVGFGGFDWLILDVITGDLNSSSTRISLYENRGYVVLNLVETCYLTVSAENGESYQLSVSGGPRIMTGSRGVYEVRFTTTGQKQLSWSWRSLVSAVSYTETALGFSGLFMMMIGPAYTAKTIRSNFTESTGQHIGYGLILFLLGFGLFYGWIM